MRPIDRRDSNPARALGGLILAAIGVLAWVAIIATTLWILAPNGALP